MDELMRYPYNFLIASNYGKVVKIKSVAAASGYRFGFGVDRVDRHRHHHHHHHSVYAFSSGRRQRCGWTLDAVRPLGRM